MPFTRKDFEYAAAYVKGLTNKTQKMLIAEAYVDVFFNSNISFRLADFLQACDITNEQWARERVFFDR